MRRNEGMGMSPGTPPWMKMGYTLCEDSVSARAMLRALLDGQTDPWELANLARGSLRGKQIQLAQAFVERVKEHHRFLLIHQLILMDVLDEHIAELDQEIAARIGPTEQEPLAKIWPKKARV